MKRRDGKIAHGELGGRRREEWSRGRGRWQKVVMVV
jgi:hypothetical protein